MTSDTTIERIESWAVDLPLPGTLSFGAFTVTARQYAAGRVITRGGLVADCLGHTRRSPVGVAVSPLLAPEHFRKGALGPAAPRRPSPPARPRLADLRQVEAAVLARHAQVQPVAGVAALQLGQLRGEDEIGFLWGGMQVHDVGDLVAPGQGAQH
mgnify:CR=1 FL=1